MACKMMYTFPSFMRLPIELQTEIFLRVPLTSLLTCKRVCKAFHTLIQNPNFRNNHKNTSHSLVLQFKHKHGNSRKIDRTSHVLVSIDNTTKEVVSYTFLTPQIPYTGMLFLVGSCNGLVCFAVRTESMYHDDILLLWNPAVSEQFRYIPIPDIHEHGYFHKRTLEFYLDPDTNDYNILSIGFSTNRVIHVAVYRMRTNSWELVDWIRLRIGVYSHNFRSDYCKRERATSVFLNGSFHWIFSSKESSEIVSFNIKDEELALIKTINHTMGVQSTIHDIGIIDESLALLRSSYGSNSINISVMTDKGVEDSDWVLKYEVRHSIDSNIWLEGFWNNSVLASDQHSLYSYDTSALTKKKLIPMPENSYLSGFSSFPIPWL